jgi:transmembrane sensor
MQNKDFNTLIDKYLNNELSTGEKENVELWVHYITDHSAAEALTAEEQKERGERIFKALGKRISAEAESCIATSGKLSGVPTDVMTGKVPGAVAGEALEVAEKVSGTDNCGLSKIIQSEEGRSFLRKLRPAVKIAAALILVSSLIFCFRTSLLETLNIYQYASISNSGSSITKAILSDGSIVWLKGNSVLTYPLKFKGKLRMVDLKGEALFEIAKDPAHPFEISCAGLKTRALGTSFNIRHARDQIEVNVLTGRVFLSSEKTPPVILHSHQKAVYLEHKKTIVKQLQPVIELASLTRGTEYMMQFNDARVSDVVHRIENKFEIEITLKDKRISNNRITADFTDQSLVNTISMMSEVFDMEFRIDGQSVTMEDKT